jgi:trafficking protein particle complex subunit 10
MVLSYDSDAIAGQSLNHGAEFLKCPRLLLYQRPESFDVKLFASRYMHLDRNRFLEIELSSGWNDVLNGEVHVRAATAGLRLQTSDVKVTNNQLEILKTSDAGVIRFGALPSTYSVRILVPFTIENEVNDIALKLEVSYTTDNGSYFFASNPSISIMLPLGVNVQDVFKHKALFSKFTISSATSSPLRLLSSKLEDSEMFTATYGVGLRNPVMIFPRQPASLLYKINRRASLTTPTNTVSPRRKDKSMLSLIIHYICLEEEIDNAVNAALSNALKDTPFHQYNRLIIPTVISQLHSRMSTYDLERTALLGELSATILSNISWRDFFSGLGKLENQGKDTALLLSQWIQNWCLQTSSIPLLPIDTSESTIAKSRSIIIPVDVPSVTVVHTADIKLLRKGSIITDNGSVVARTNESISAVLEIKWTRIWDTTPSPPMSPQAPTARQDMHFVYEISAPNDTWLLGGKRTGHFLIPSSKEAASTSAVMKFPILMIPLKEGYLPFPHLEIKPQVLPPATMQSPVAEVKSPQAGMGVVEQGRKGSGGSGGSGDGVTAAGIAGGATGKAAAAAGGAGIEKITSEMDYRNVAETVRVISNAASTTLSLDTSGPQGGAWLLESERRISGDDGDEDGDDGGLLVI